MTLQIGWLHEGANWHIDHDPRLLPAEREAARSAGSTVSVWMEATQANVLVERKKLLA